MKNKLLKMFFGLAIIIIGGLTLEGCTTSRLVDVWKDPKVDFGNVNKVVVIAAFDVKSRRRIWEDSFVSILSKNGITAEPSYKFFPKDIPSPEDVRKMFDKDYDGVVLLRQLNTKVFKRYVPGDYFWEPVGWYRMPFFRSYRTVYAGFHTPGYFTKERLFRFEASLYQTNEEGTLIWDAVGEIQNPGSQKELSKELSNMVVPEMMDIKNSKSPE